MSLQADEASEDSTKRKRPVPMSTRISRLGRAFGAYLRRVTRSGRRRFTIMFIPHSEKRVLNLQMNTFALALVAVVAAGVIAAFFYLASVYSGSERVVQQTGARLRSAEENLEQVRQEIRDFLQVYDEFEQTLSGTLHQLNLSSDGDGTMPASGGDLAGLVNLEEVRDDDLREILDLQRLVASLRDAMGPLSDISEVLDLNRQLLSDIPNYWPVVNGLGIVNMEFGPNVHPVTNLWYMNKGIEIQAPIGTPVVSAANGVVTAARVDSVGGYGSYIEINHNFGFKTKYGHLLRYVVAEGQSVEQGQVIGYIGSSGVSTGPYLDFQIWIGTENIDPAHFLKLSKPDFSRRTVSRR